MRAAQVQGIAVGPLIVGFTALRAPLPVWPE